MVRSKWVSAGLINFMLMMRTVLQQDSRVGGAAKRPGDQSRVHDGGGAQETQGGLQSTGERQEHTDRAA